MPTTRARSANAAAQGQINEQENLQPQNPVEEGEVREAQAEQADLPDQGRTNQRRESAQDEGVEVETVNEDAEGLSDEEFIGTVAEVANSFDSASTLEEQLGDSLDLEPQLDTETPQPAAPAPTPTGRRTQGDPSTPTYSQDASARPPSPPSEVRVEPREGEQASTDIRQPQAATAEAFMGEEAPRPVATSQERQTLRNIIASLKRQQVQLKHERLQAEYERRRLADEAERLEEDQLRHMRRSTINQPIGAATLRVGREDVFNQPQAHTSQSQHRSDLSSSSHSSDSSSTVASEIDLNTKQGRSLEAQFNNELVSPPIEDLNPGAARRILKAVGQRISSTNQKVQKAAMAPFLVETKSGTVNVLTSPAVATEDEILQHIERTNKRGGAVSQFQIWHSTAMTNSVTGTAADDLEDHEDLYTFPRTIAGDPSTTLPTMQATAMPRAFWQAAHQGKSTSTQLADITERMSNNAITTLIASQGDLKGISRKMSELHKDAKSIGPGAMAVWNNPNTERHVVSAVATFCKKKSDDQTAQFANAWISNNKGKDKGILDFLKDVKEEMSTHMANDEPAPKQRYRRVRGPVSDDPRDETETVFMRAEYDGLAGKTKFVPMTQINPNAPTNLFNDWYEADANTTTNHLPELMRAGNEAYHHMFHTGNTHRWYRKTDNDKNEIHVACYSRAGPSGVYFKKKPGDRGYEGPRKTFVKIDNKWKPLNSTTPRDTSSRTHRRSNANERRTSHSNNNYSRHNRGHQGRYSGNGNRDRYNRPQAHSAVRINPGLEGRFQASIKACTSNKAKPMNI
ncbi:hypothetical protein THAOC_02120 [Thalassiosira oceanica]|uniref:Uncharacterized protein n=1 Tax=Thalassiosira oceanica TaxID=159749 RepID=K0TQJ0_THAOC|nr:hypothetical protein THAOC_02120 [Thalassiosira oceanica]|eukprot:EJK76132.1 hypothetical protein THAOC_02120 [Thalassiosira oceanica]